MSSRGPYAHVLSTLCPVLACVMMKALSLHPYYQRRGQRKFTHYITQTPLLVRTETASQPAASCPVFFWHLQRSGGEEEKEEKERTCPPSLFTFDFSPPT
ncbi:unnamed protein product [Pleuronectes platessa]|uniref:Uncharacterized protein n=1 Tax=Pleuronectes platessa TaxID=8262 RepID=A0A9N7TZA0_PLEPL|nr:unnamed protein product [Pleuronectes platessa]